MQISDTVKFVLLLATLILILVSPFLWPNHNVVVMYDCQIAEISPDFPQAAKELCRRKMEKHDR